MTEKAFFSFRTPAEIRDNGNELSSDNSLVERILDLDPKDHLVITKPIIPERFTSPSKYKKHAHELKLKRFDSVKEIKEQKVIPVRLREEAFDNLHNAYLKTGKMPFLSGYSFRSPKGSVDEVLRKVSLVDAISGAWIFGYSHQVPGVGIILEEYDDSRRTQIEGGSFVFSVPSRTEKKGRHDVGLESVAVIDNDQKYVIAQNINSDHTCKDKRYNKQLRFKHLPEKGQTNWEKSRVIQFCPHDIAAYLELVDTHWNRDKNLVPLMASQFAIPTQYTVDFYLKLLNNVLVQDIHTEGKNSGKTYLRPLNKAEQEPFVWALAIKEGHDKTFFARQDLKTYNWNRPGE